MTDIVARLSLDAGQRTLGQLIQDREAAAHESAFVLSSSCSLPQATLGKELNVSPFYWDFIVTYLPDRSPHWSTHLAETTSLRHP
jgi:hypothetical protein